MVRFFVYINNKQKIDDPFLFYARVRLAKPYLPLSIYVKHVFHAKKKNNGDVRFMNTISFHFL